MRIKRMHSALVLSAAVVVLAAGCGSSTNSSGGTFTPPNLQALQTLGPGEGKLNILSWPGYAENGSTDPAYNWVGPFEKQTGCKTSVTTFGTSDEAFDKFTDGSNSYDVVSASGDASLRLVAGGWVEPVNTKLVPNYADVIPTLKNQPWNTVNGVNYGIPHGRGANLLVWRTDKVNPAPTSWQDLFQTNAATKGRITPYGGPIYLADAALVLMKTQPDLKITNPYALDQTQFDAAVKLLQQQRPNVSEYWTDATKQIDSFKGSNPASVIGQTWQYQVNNLPANQIKAIKPSEGATGWSDTWMVGAKSPNKVCAYKWMNYIISPKVNDEVAQYFGEAPANAKACTLSAASATNCKTFHALDEAYWKNVYYWTTPIAKCLDGRTDVKCIDYKQWQDAFNRIKG
jgi:putative spermidine/putrescine transport system substrate-binding protein